ncbi:DUF6308 family protein [Gordonia amarae]|nr:DUF6308 family protein [Gordonia amarae]
MVLASELATTGHDGEQAMQIPHALQSDDPTRAKNVLQAYFGDPYLHDGFTGASFDSWDSLGTRDADANVFTADDLIAVTLLSVNAGPRAAQALLRDRRAEFSPLLAEIGPDRDLADEPGPITPAWPAWRLENQLLTVHGIGLTIASKLIARKRPRLYPIWDTVVVDVLGTRGKHLASIHEALRTTPALRRRISKARKEAHLPEDISELRILDVLAWMQGARGQTGLPEGSCRDAAKTSKTRLATLTDSRCVTGTS